MCLVKTSLVLRALPLALLLLGAASCHHTTEPCAPPTDFSGLSGLPAQDYLKAVARVHEICGHDLPQSLSSWLESESRGERTRTVPAELSETWNELCPKQPASGIGTGSLGVEREALLRDCGPAVFGLSDTSEPTARGFRHALGNPVLGALTRQWLLKRQDASTFADGVARALVGPLPYLSDSAVSLPALPFVETGETLPPTARVVLLARELRVDGKTLSKANEQSGRFSFPLGTDPFQGWSVQDWSAARVDTERAPVLAVESSIAVHEFLRLAATVGHEAKPLRVLAEHLTSQGADSVGSLELLLPSAKDQEDPTRVMVELGRQGIDLRNGAEFQAPIQGCDASGPTLCLEATRAAEPSLAAHLSSVLGPILENSTTKAVYLQSDPSLDLNAMLGVASALRQVGARVVLSLDHEPCVWDALGMACVPGGPTRVGDPSGGLDKKAPARRLEIPTFYLDTHEVTVGEYRSCVSDRGFCPKPAGFPARPSTDGSSESLPVVGLPWEAAQRFCGWAGKRLPTEYEWEKAASLSWNLDRQAAADCDSAWHSACLTGDKKPTAPKGPRPALQGKPSPILGLLNMNGNVAEWSSSWIESSLKSCGKACQGSNPLGPCGGSSFCSQATQRSLRGGSFLSKAQELDPLHRRGSAGGPQRTAGVRCAISGGEDSDPPAFLGRGADLRSPLLTRWPPLQITRPLPDPGPLAPPSEAELAIARDVYEDDIEDKPVCGEDVVSSWNFPSKKGGRSEVSCRDPVSYPYSNEKKIWLFRPYAANVGGGYTGVGSDQNYDFIAAAKSSWVWLFDYDPNVVKLHRALKPLILAAETPEAFVAYFKTENLDEGSQLIRDYYKGDKKVEIYRRAYMGYHRLVGERYERKLKKRAEDPEYGWLSDPSRYAWIRTLHQQGRIQILAGDMLADKAMRSIGAAAEKLGVPMRIFYTSNAPTSWGGQITPAWRANVTALPFDDASVIIVTWNHGSFGGKDYWHYQVQRGLTYQKRLQNYGYTHMFQLVWDRIPAADADLTLVGLPSE